LTSQKFSRDIPYLSEIYKNSWGIYSGGEEITAELKFNKDKESHFTRRFLTDEQEVNYVPNGIIVKMKVKLSLEFIAWVLGWGDGVVIIAPDKLREQVLAKAKGLIDNHKN
jgi:predicted DNA-binding transcriptional regulator YafY